MKVGRVLTHIDLDGAACGVVAKLAWDCEVEYHDYDTIDEAVERSLREIEGVVVMADISPGKEMLESLGKLSWDGEWLLIFDHHKSSSWAAMHKELPIGGRFDETRCGAALLLEYVFKQEKVYSAKVADSLQRYVEVAETRDLWRTDSKLWDQALAHHILLFHIGIENYVARRIRFPEELEKVHSTEMEMVVEPALRKKERYVAKKVELARRAVDKDGHVFYWVVARSETSQVGHALCELPDAEYAVILNFEDGKVEMRADGKVNVGDIAKSRGGGGHPNASGYTLTDWDEWCSLFESRISG